MRTLLLLALLLSFAVNAQVQPVIDSLRHQTTIEKDKAKLAALYKDLVDQWAEANFDSADFYARKMQAIALSVNDPVLRGNALLTRGIPHDYHSHFDSARYYYLQAFNYSKKYNDSTGWANATFNLAVLSYFEGNYFNAIDRFKEAEVIYQALNDEKHLSRLYNNMGTIYRKTEQFEAAINTYQQSLAIKEKNNDIKGILNTLTNLSSLYINSHDYVSGEKNSLRVIDLAKSVGDSMAYTSELVNLGIISQHLGKPKEGLKYLVEADRRLATSDQQRIRSECWINIADHYIASGNFPGAYQYIKKIEPLLPPAATEVTVSYYKLLSSYYAAVGDFRQGYHAQQKLAEAKENYISERLKQKTKELEIRYETEKNERQIAELEVEKQAASISLIESANQRNLLIVLIAALIITAVLIYIRYRDKEKLNALLTEKNNVISQSLAEREVLLREIHHRVKNNLQIISSLLNLQSKSMENNAAQSAVMESRNRVKSMALIHEQLYQEDTLTGVSMPDYIRQLTDTLGNSYGVDHDKIEVKVQSDPLILDVDTAIPIGLALNELVSNAFKYAFTGRPSGRLDVGLHQVNGHLQLTVSDDGNGLKDNGRKDSFGLNLVNSLARRLRAEVVIDSNSGTRVELKITDFKIAR